MTLQINGILQSYLSALLKERALELYVWFSKDDRFDNDRLKEDLLANFDLT